MIKLFRMKKFLILIVGLCFCFNSCTTHKIYTKLVQTENKKVYLSPLIIIPTNSISKNSSEKLKLKLNDALLNKNLNATIHLLEIKPDELKLNNKETSMLDEILPIYEKNNNDVIILFKYEEFNYGAYGDSFTQRVLVFEKDAEKIVWTAVGFSTYEGINKYCVEMVDKLLLDKVIAY